MSTRSRLFFALAACAGSAALSGCKSHGEIVVEEGVGITAIRTSCPAVGIPDYTGDVTLFRDPAVSDANAIDVSAAMTNVRAQCNQPSFNARQARHRRRSAASSGNVISDVSFTVEARRNDTHGARSVTLPYFVTVVRGGTAVISKRVGTVTLNFADGQARAEAAGRGEAIIDKAEATLPRDVRDRITQKRKAGEADAATDPLADPEVRSAVDRATFEVLVGFQLDDKQLGYNATR